MNELDLIPVDRLAAWLDDQGVASGPIEGLELLTGGTQNILARFARAGQGLVLRRPPRHPRPGAARTIEREVTVLAALAGSRVPHPRLRAAALDEATLGAVCYVMDEVAGFTATTSIPERVVADKDLQQRMGLAVVDALAEIARVDITESGLSSLGRVDGWLERQVDRWARQLDSYAEHPGWPGADLPGLREVTDWLRTTQPETFTPGLIHGDFHFGNVMLDVIDDAPIVTAVVDWELATVADPLLDLGHLLATWPNPHEPRTRGLAAVLPGLPDKAAIVARYSAGSRRDVTVVDWYHVLACYRLGIILEGTQARACAGHVPVELGERFHGVAQSLFEQAVQVIATTSHVDASSPPASPSSDPASTLSAGAPS